MYEIFYGLREEPFRLSPDSRLCFVHPSYKKAKAYMQYALQRREGFVMVTGRPGTGKTTLINDITTQLSKQGNLHASLTSTQIRADDLLRLVVLKFGLNADTDYKAELIHRLENFLYRLHREGRRPLLIIDEAQDLATDALEELRLLTNLQKDNQPLLQIFLVGQEELRQTVLIPELEQLHQRIVAACHLTPLTSDSTAAYIKHRLGRVGWDNDPELSDKIFEPIYRYSLGIPRIVNQICSRLLLHGMVEEKHKLGLEDVREVIDSLNEEQLLPIPA
ncbi:MAG: AAA family ATPase [Pseudomonadales bacterium]|nr:AAA family ATPase [Halioglobus sp.]MCP5129877.1 AAA family ATPase [Pseudomonadales bacterium]